VWHKQKISQKEPASSEAPRSTQSIADSGSHTTISLPLVIQDGRTHYYLQYEDVCDPSKNYFMNIIIYKQAKVDIWIDCKRKH